MDLPEKRNDRSNKKKRRIETDEIRSESEANMYDKEFTNYEINRYDDDEEQPQTKKQRIETDEIKLECDSNIDELDEIDYYKINDEDDEQSPIEKQTVETDEIKLERDTNMNEIDTINYYKIHKYNEDEINGMNNIEDEDESKNSGGWWSKKDTLKLLMQMRARCPPNDKLIYTKRTAKLEWDKVKFKKYSGDECRKKWDELKSKVRRYRILEELINDVQNITESKVSLEELGVPRRPLTCYMAYYMAHLPKVLRNNPGLGTAQAAKYIAQNYKKLSGKKLEKYKRMANQLKEEYDEKMKIFYENNPDHLATKKKRNSDKAGPPKLFHSGYQLFTKTIMPTLKDIPPAARLFEVGRRWKALDRSKKKEYTILIKQLNDELLNTKSDTVKRNKLIDGIMHSATTLKANGENIVSSTPLKNSVGLDASDDPHLAGFYLFRSELLSSNPSFNNKIPLEQQIMDQWNMLKKKKKRKYAEVAALKESEADSQSQTDQDLQSENAPLEEDTMLDTAAFNIFRSEVLSTENEWNIPNEQQIMDQWNSLSRKKRKKYKKKAAASQEILNGI